MCEQMPEGRRSNRNMVIILAEPETPNCNVCGVHTVLGIWNYGYKPEFLAKVLMCEFESPSDEYPR